MTKTELQRCAPKPDDSILPVTRIEICFDLSVHLSKIQYLTLCALMQDIVEQPCNQRVDGVHWVSTTVGGRSSLQEGVLTLGTTARPFESNRERIRGLRYRLNQKLREQG